MCRARGLLAPSLRSQVPRGCSQRERCFTLRRRHLRTLWLPVPPTVCGLGCRQHNRNLTTETFLGSAGDVRAWPQGWSAQYSLCMQLTLTCSLSRLLCPLGRAPPYFLPVAETTAVCAPLPQGALCGSRSPDRSWTFGGPRTAPVPSLPCPEPGFWPAGVIGRDADNVQAMPSRTGPRPLLLACRVSPIPAQAAVSETETTQYGVPVTRGPLHSFPGLSGGRVGCWAGFAGPHSDPTPGKGRTFGLTLPHMRRRGGRVSPTLHPAWLEEIQIQPPVLGPGDARGPLDQPGWRRRSWSACSKPSASPSAPSLLQAAPLREASSFSEWTRTVPVSPKDGWDQAAGHSRTSQKLRPQCQGRAGRPGANRLC